MPISANFSVEGSSAVQAHVVAYGATVDFEILSLTGVETIEWSIIGTSKASQSAPTITPAGSPSGATATVTMPSDPGDGLGRGFIMKAIVRAPGGAETAVAFRVFGAANAGGVIPVVANEENYRSLTHGWIDEFNQAMAQAGIQFGTGNEVGDKPEWSGAVWVQRRGRIVVDYDVTGAVDATSAIQTALSQASASATRGRWVEIPYGICKVGSTHGSSNLFTVPWGCTLTGEERGRNAGYRLFEDGSSGSPSMPHVGTLLKVGASGHGTGRLFTPQYNSAIKNLEIDYVAQNKNSAPVAHDYTFYIGDNQHWVSLENIVCGNPYNFIRTSSGANKFEDIAAYPLNRGIVTVGQMSSLHVSDLSFNAVHFDTGATLRAWVQANGAAFLLDGVEAFDFTDCGIFGYNLGIWFKDEDADSFYGCYGTWKGGSVDQCNYCIVVENPTGLSAMGFKMSDSNLIPNVNGWGVMFQDTHVAASVPERPSIHLTDVNLHQFGGLQYAAQIQSGSYGILRWKDSNLLNMTVAGVANGSSTADALMNGVGVASGVARSSGTVTDVNQVTL
jgi:hypothetical protein